MNQENPPADHAGVDSGDGGSAIEDNLKSRSTWIRFLFMIAFIVIANVAAMVATIVVILGFLWVLLTGETNEQLRQAGRALASYFADIVRFLTYNSETKPFPFGADWPSADD
ncbi:MAG: DUF4389 domain-containing protein [Pseudomonadota bacterium]